MKCYISDTKEYKTLDIASKDMDGDIEDQECYLYLLEEDFEFDEKLNAYCCESEIFEFWHDFLKSLRKVEFEAGVERFEGYYESLKVEYNKIIEEDDGKPFARDNYRKKLSEALHEIQFENLIDSIIDTDDYTTLELDDKEKAIEHIMNYACALEFTITETEAKDAFEILLKILEEYY